MKWMILKLLLIAAAHVGGIEFARAEGRCPPGQYPVGGGGVLGCAPIPGYGSQGNSQRPDDSGPATLSRPPGRWIGTWGAIGFSRINSIGAFALGRYLSEEDAGAAAVKNCAELGGEQCVVTYAFYDQCAATARLDRVLAAAGGSKEVAKADAIAKCEEVAKREGINGVCEITWSDCAERAYVYH